MDLSLFPALIGLLGLIVALGVYRSIIRCPSGEGQIVTIGKKIQRGALTFIRREFRVLIWFVFGLGALIFFKDGFEAVAFFLGALCSAVAGLIGLSTATHANTRTTVAADNHGMPRALSVAFMGGSVMGITVASLGLLGIGTLFIFFGQTAKDIHVIHGFAMGASLVALFFRVGGGIFTKAADVGADLVGKVEQGLPEDDPRNPAVIADNVGDNVGDVAGMGSDIFESYCGAQIASMAIAATLTFEQVNSLQASKDSLLFLPLALTSIGLFCSLIGIFLVKQFAANKPDAALRTGTLGSAALFIAGSLGITAFLDISSSIWFCIISGCIGGILIGLVTEYYTAGKPVREIARQSQMGPATVIITGFSVGLQSVVLPMLFYAGIIFLCSSLAGIYGVAIAAVGMLSTVGMTMAIDAYGPIADNAGGIAQMAGLKEKTRKITDSLDEVGNTTAAIGKGFAIGAAGLAALAIITAYINTLDVPYLALELSNPSVLIGLLIGGMIPFLVASITMDAVGKAASDMIAEIRKQFKLNPALKEGEGEPDAESCVDIATRSALWYMILPSLIAVFAPPLVGFTLGAATLGGMLGGALVSAILLALMMANSGGAWDNAKKNIEGGNYGGKGSPEHEACVVGDTVGDPFKDTSGPSMNILINVMAIVSLVIAPLLTH